MSNQVYENRINKYQAMAGPDVWALAEDVIVISTQTEVMKFVDHVIDESRTAYTTHNEDGTIEINSTGMYAINVIVSWLSATDPESTAAIASISIHDEVIEDTPMAETYKTFTGQTVAIVETLSCTRYFRQEDVFSIQFTNMTVPAAMILQSSACKLWITKIY